MYFILLGIDLKKKSQRYPGIIDCQKIIDTYRCQNQAHSLIIMVMKHRISHLLMSNPETYYVSILDESHKHAGHQGIAQIGNSHFRLVVVSSIFETLSLIKRHQWIYQMLDQCIKDGVHAISITAKTPSEFFVSD